MRTLKSEILSLISDISISIFAIIQQFLSSNDGYWNPRIVTTEIVRVLVELEKEGKIVTEIRNRKVYYKKVI